MHVGKEIGIIMRQSQSCLAKRFQNIDITISEYMFLINIPDEGYLTQKEICNELVIDEACATRAIKSLQKKELIYKTKSIKDKRAFEITLTDEGRKRKVKVFEILDDWNKIILSDFSEENKIMIKSYLEKMLKNTLEQKEK